MSCRDLDQLESIMNLCDTKLQDFVPNFFNFKTISVLSIFENVVASMDFTSNFFCALPQLSPVGEIRHSAGGVDDAKAPHTVSL